VIINVTKKFWMILLLFIIISHLIITTSLATTWSSGLQTPGGHWSITRQSSGVGIMESNSVIRGSITPIRVTPSGRSVNSVASKYSSMMANDVGSKEKISAFEGRIIIQEGLIFAYNDSGGYNSISTYYPGGHYLEEDHELYPVLILSRNIVNYKGTQINDLGYVENTYDRIGEELLYNKNLEKDLYVNTSLDRFNVTVEYANRSLTAEIQPTKHLNYIMSTKTSGIADLFTRVVDTRFDVQHQNYPYSMQNEERYVGNYNIQRKIQMNYTFIIPSDEDLYPGENWLPCSCLKDDFNYPEYYNNSTFKDQLGM
jgi:hypothetical protein